MSNRTLLANEKTISVDLLMGIELWFRLLVKRGKDHHLSIMKKMKKHVKQKCKSAITILRNFEILLIVPMLLKVIK